MYHYTYKITNILDGRKYIGCRSSKAPPLEDIAYFGSCKSLKQDIHKYGLENFTKEVISTFTNRHEALADEIRMHDLYDVVRNPEFYNRAKQTSTSFCRQGVKLTDEERLKCRPHNIPSGKDHWGYGKPDAKSGKTYEEFYGKERSVLIKQKYAANMTWKSGKDHAFYGKKHTEETKEKISKANKGKPGRLGKKSSEETKKKISEFRKNSHISIHDYEVIDPNGKIYIVEKIGLRFWLKTNFDENVSTAHKTSLKTKEPVKRGKWKGWKFSVIDNQDKNCK